jgi:hypothetical protein
MADRRQAVRREPIEVEVQDKVYTAKPRTWIEAGDIGNEILRQNSEATNNAVRMYMEGDIPQLETTLRRKIENWDSLLLLGYPGYERGEFAPYDLDECFELGKAMLEVNHLEYLLDLIDPNSPPPDLNGGNEPSVDGDGQKTQSSPSSSSPDSPEMPSLT